MLVNLPASPPPLGQLVSASLGTGTGGGTANAANPARGNLLTGQ